MLLGPKDVPDLVLRVCCRRSQRKTSHMSLEHLRTDFLQAQGILTNFQSLIFIGVVGAGTYRSVLLSAPGAALGAAFSVGVGYLAQRYRNLRTALYCFSVLICLSCTAVLWRLPLTAKSGLVYGMYVRNRCASLWCGACD